jgi:hypothetical protein
VNDKPTLSGSDLTPDYVEGLLSKTVVCHVDVLQNICLFNVVRNDGKLIVKMEGDYYDVTPSKVNPEHFTLTALTVTISWQGEKESGQPISALLGQIPAPVLSWGWKAFQEEVIAGKIAIRGVTFKG